MSTLSDFSINPDSIVVSSGEIFISTIGVPTPTITPLASPAPSATQFTIGSTDAAFLAGLRHLLQLAATTINWTLSEAMALPRIAAIVAVGTAFNVQMAGTGFATAPATGSASVAVPWRCLGSTDGDIVINSDLTTTDHTVDQSLDPVLVTVTGRTTNITAPLAEITPHALALAFGAAPPTPGQTGFSIGATLATPRQDRVLVVGRGTSAARRAFLFHRAVNDGQANLALSKTNKQIINIEFKAFRTMVNGVPRVLDVDDFAAA